MDVTSTSLQRRLDAVDCASRTLRALQLDTKFQRDIQGAVPQFVAVGNQSSGKSSLLRRVGKIPLPEAVKRCTRLPILLQLRRDISGNDNDNTTPPTIRLCLPSGDSVDHTPESNDEAAVLAAIQKAQQDAVQRAQTNFAKDYVVEIMVRRPDVPNVTLVDLPGFFDPSASEKLDAEAVARMCDAYIDMEGTLVLHVVGADQDYGSVLRKEKLGEAAKTAPGKVSVVLTKLDLLDKQGGEKACVSFQDTLDKIDANNKFAVLGSAASDDDEDMSMRGLSMFSDDVIDVGWGVRALNVHLEARIAEHLDTQLPKACAKLEAELHRAERDLEGVKKRDPNEVLAATRDTIREAFEGSTKELHTSIHEEIFRFTHAVQFLVIRPLPKDKHSAPLDEDKEQDAVDLSSDQLKKYAEFVDELVWVASPTRAADVNDADEDGDDADEDGDDADEDVEVDSAIVAKKFIQAVVVAVQENAYELVKRDGTAVKCEPHEIRVSQLNIAALRDQLRRTVRMQGLRNLGYNDPQIPLERYMSDFADRYAKEARHMMRQVRTLVWGAYDRAFQAPDILEVGSGVVTALRSSVLALFRELDEEATSSVNRIMSWNKPPLVFSTNEHYLLQNYRVMRQSGPLAELAKCLKGTQPNVPRALQVVTNHLAPVTDDDVVEEAAQEIYSKMKAYWKVQVKQVTEAAAKEACRIYLVVGAAKFKEASERVPPTVVKEKEDRERKRALFDNRVKILRQALAELENVL